MQFEYTVHCQTVYLNTELFLKIPLSLLHIGRVHPAMNISLCNVLTKLYKQQETLLQFANQLLNIYKHTIYSENNKMLLVLFDLKENKKITLEGNLVELKLSSLRA